MTNLKICAKIIKLIFPRIILERKEGILIMLRKILTFFLILSCLAILTNGAEASPENWLKPWGKEIELQIFANHPFSGKSHATLKGGYAVDFVTVPRVGTRGDYSIKCNKLYAPTSGKIICSNFWDETMKLSTATASCPYGHDTNKDYSQAYGHHIIIEPDDGGENYRFIMGHFYSQDCAPLETFKQTDENGNIVYRVNKGDFIAYLGNTGNSYPAHLHFELINQTDKSKWEDIKLFGITREQFGYDGDGDKLFGDITETSEEPPQTDIPPSITIENNYLIQWPITKKIDFSLVATGSEPITWSQKSGSLPSGVKINENGSITGTATQSGKFTFTVRAKNSVGEDSRTLILDIYEANELPKITTTSIKDATIDKSYSVTIKASGRKITKWTASGLPIGLEINASSGKISGTPTEHGTFTLKITAKNELGSVSNTLSLNVCKEPSIITTSIPSTGYTYEKYSGVTFNADATPAPTWSITVLSSLPPGLKINKNTGELSGTPTTKGTYNFTVKATNKIGSDTKKFKIVVKVGDPQISTKSLPKAKVGTAYSTQLTGNNLPSGSAWAATSTLPAGLTLSKTGILSGTPQRAGTFYIDVKAINKQGVQVMNNFTLNVTGTMKITTASLSDATVGEKYKITLKASGATSYMWLARSTLPAGLTLSSKGVLSGTPVHASDNSTIYVRVLDAYGGYTDKNFSLKITDGLAITTESLSNATVGKNYEAKLMATGATDIAWCARSSLPPGLMLTSDGVLSGTPACTGNYTVYVRAINAYGTYVDKNLKLTVGGNEKNSAQAYNMTVGKKFETSFSISFPNRSGDVTLSKSGTMPKGLSLSLIGTTVKISGTPKAAGIFRVKATLKDKAGASVYKYISLTVYDNLKISTGQTLTSGKVGKKYSKTLKATGSDSFVWCFEGGNGLPSGLTISPSGVLSGTPLYTANKYVHYFRAYTPYGTYVQKGFYLTVIDSSTTSNSSKSNSSSPTKDTSQNENQNGNNEIDTQENQQSEQNQIDTLITERGDSALNEEILTGFKNDGYIVAAMLPKIEVTDEGIHDFTVSLDKNVPVGSKLLWRSLPLNGANINDDDDSALFANRNGEEISTSPEDFNVIVSAWLRTDTAYEPVILAKPEYSTEANSESDSQEKISSSGCNIGAFGIVLLLMSIGAIKGKN